ncbi:hypothetical protein T06_13183 [Trichinella sp. T6]|nr:hypothetical protein T06_13183 [Trichinella sp. T6]
MYIPKQQYFIGHPLLPKILNSILFTVPAHRLSYVPPGRSGSSSPVPAYSGSSPESQIDPEDCRFVVYYRFPS